MRIDEGEEAVLKTWIVKKLEHMYVSGPHHRRNDRTNVCRSSDADSDVLADYVLALLKSDDPDEQIRKNCLEALPDFLKDSMPLALHLHTLKQPHKLILPLRHPAVC